jgi:hypothetical protein
MKNKFAILNMLVLVIALLSPITGIASDERDFIIKYGVMEPSSAMKDRLRETQEISMDPSRRPGWCFIVDPPNDELYEVYSIHYLPNQPSILTGDFSGEELSSTKEGIITDAERTNGIRPFCFDFHHGDPLGEYKVEVIINGNLKKTLRLSVVSPISSKSEGNE